MKTPIRVPLKIADPCLPAIGAPNAASLSLVLDAATGGVNLAISSVVSAAKFELNLATADISAIVASVKALLTLGTLPALPSINLAAINAILKSIESQLVSYAAKTAATIVSNLLNGLANIAVEELRKDLAPALKLLDTVRATLGRLEAYKALATAVFQSQGCLAKAELLSEIYFAAKR